MRYELKKIDELLVERCLLSFTELQVMDYAFFPGGNGLHNGINTEDFPVKGTLILGSDFGCSTKFVDGKGNLMKKDERGGPTWKPMLELLSKTPIDYNKCFYSNAWPFLHLPSDKNGDSNDNPPVDVWLRDTKLMDYCKSFFKCTLETVNPRLIVALGKGPAAFLGEFWPDKLSFWRFPAKRKWDTFSWKDIDKSFLETILLDNHSVTCVAITHPSKSRLNAKYRKPPYQGIEGEIRLLTEAARTAGIGK